ncbi:hypothetical protein ASG89_09430 [Paenibacillus sp. Soil766]|uniref:sensor histidine kinase n=1 Tax=Paenibacillus sp. Soil766 TaxID=1736404 RepID=UPI00070E72CF|nr:sensor histidine kinase [Paenibacillus sp. Soil766]KRE90497.1 hypothetical protein ASG89_09430 [Paenibacillus sp. Soil766]
MQRQLHLTRYLLILIPAIASMYLENYASNDTYTLLVLLYFAMTEIRRTRFPHAFPMLLIEIGSVGWMNYYCNGIWFIAFFSTLLTFGDHTTARTQFPVWLIQLLVLNLTLLNQPTSYYIIANLMYLALTLILFQLQQTKQNKEDVHLLFDQLRKQHYDLDEARLRLLDYARKVEHIAQTEERNRISHDLHDDLGHKLIRLKMMMEASLSILPIQPKKGTEMLGSVRDQLGESMELLRSTVRRLKPDEQSLHGYSLHKLIEGLKQENGIHIEMSIEGMPYDLYPSMEFILYRNAQEAITNAIRHGSATQVHLVLKFTPHQVSMAISNNGKRASEPLVKGLGLTGMEERSKLIGGNLLIADEDLYTVTTVLPTFRHVHE